MAGGTPFNITLDELGKTRPPEFSSNKLMSLEVIQVASGFVIMTMVNNGSLKCVVWGNIYMSLVSEDAFRDLPVG